MVEVHVREDDGVHLVGLLGGRAVLLQDLGGTLGEGVEDGEGVLHDGRGQVFEIGAHAEVEEEGLGAGCVRDEEAVVRGIVAGARGGRGVCRECVVGGFVGGLGVGEEDEVMGNEEVTGLEEVDGAG